MITVKSNIHAPLDKVWQYFTLPEHITKWNFASPDWHCPAAENNLTKGGSFSFTMAAKDGSFSFDLKGVYQEVIPLKAYSYLLEDGRLVEVSFNESSNGILLTEVFEPEKENTLELQQAGWQAILDNFAKYTSEN